MSAEILNMYVNGYETTDKPHNPLVNSGAIMSAVLLLSLVRNDLIDMASKFEFVTDYIRVSFTFLYFI